MPSPFLILRELYFKLSYMCFTEIFVLIYNLNYGIIQ